MKQLLLLALSLSLSFSVFAQIPNGYYDNAQGLTGEQLKTALHYIIDNHNSQSYNSLWSHFHETDKKPNGKVWDMYSDVPGGTPPYQYTFGSNQCGSYSGEGDCYNREHSFPKSWFGDSSPMNTDLFHLVPTDGYVNGKRSNHAYGETNNPSWTSENGCKVGSNSTSGFSGTIFEPIDEYKGDFARSYFYMATRYENKISNWNSDMLNHTSFPAYKDWALELLLAWNAQDPVSQKEIDRNNAIHDIQNNRNPYIDHVEYVAMVWGGSTPPVITNISYSPAIPEAFEEVTVNATITDNGSVEEATLLWGLTTSAITNEVDMSSSSSSFSAAIPGQADGVTIYFKLRAIDDEDFTTYSTVNQYTVNAQPGTIALPFSEDFEGGDLGIFFQNSVIGPDQVWENSDYEENHYAKMSNYDGNSNIQNEDWLITPAINFNQYLNEKMEFMSAMKDYDGNNIKIYLMYSTDYTGEGDPNNASWTDISNRANWSPGEYEFVSSGIVDLSDLNGTFVSLAFKYVAPTGSSNGRTWEIDDINVDADLSVIESNTISDIKIFPNPSNGNITLSGNLFNNYQVTIFNSLGCIEFQKSQFISNTQSFDISNLSKGLYFITISDNNGLSITKKLMIN